MRPSLVPGEYFIVAGERRYRAFQSLGEQFTDCIIKVNDAENATLALTENLSREDLIDYEVAKAILVVESKWDNKTMLAEYLGISRSILYRYLSYRKLPNSVLEMLDEDPTLLSAKTSEEVIKVAKDHGLQDDEFATS
ncbi:Nucleoid occlusion protein [Moraxella ovis]|uniref:Nucleoid occlusion protein n=1 Tax=Moraxella ovis TaxID=29433 RepID=A0A378PNK4_9GAMM|nr:Nucleoid occlusion protein [Moraxella ovis]